MLATCETYISCVKNVCQHLTQEDIGINDMHRVQGELTDSLGTYSYTDSTAWEHTATLTAQLGNIHTTVTAQLGNIHTTLTAQLGNIHTTVTAQLRNIHTTVTV